MLERSLRGDLGLRTGGLRDGRSRHKQRLDLRRRLLGQGRGLGGLDQIQAVSWFQVIKFHVFSFPESMLELDTQRVRKSEFSCLATAQVANTNFPAVFQQLLEQVDFPEFVGRSCSMYWDHFSRFSMQSLLALRLSHPYLRSFFPARAVEKLFQAQDLAKKSPGAGKIGAVGGNVINASEQSGHF